MGFLASFLYSQLLVTLPKPTKDFSGQTIIVTGSNTGLGYEAARHLSKLNASLLILAVRNHSKGEAAKRSILTSTSRDDSSIEVWDLDMQSAASIAAFCVRAHTLPRLDAVLANAGIMTKHFTLVAGYESTIMTNVIGTSLLALGLLPKLKLSAAEFNMNPRLSLVASDLHFIAKFPEGKAKDIFAALNDKEKAQMGMPRYCDSKLLQVFFVRELGARLSQPKTQKGETSSKPAPVVVINCLTPGACQSDFDRESTGISRMIGNLMSKVVARTTEAGSRTLIAAIAAGEESQGGYMADCVVSEPGPPVLGEAGTALQAKVWEQLMTQLERIQPGISKGI